MVKVVVVAPAIYLMVILFVRIAGKRSTSQMNNFDWIVTVALGSITGSTIILEDVSLARGALAIALLLALQVALTRWVRRSSLVARTVEASPTVLFSNGRFHDEEMERERVSRSEVYSAVREDGMADMSQIAFVILENDASFSVLTKSVAASGDALDSLREREGATGMPERKAP
ncbi:hypothetical protein LK12_12140 [Novosphingobium malaysiense]|uniref:DUF421 domain-containing protein n=2 Tax=Novosphingobium malaysiense TaxID=1348853 RepID=A0A0B1ZRX5_9SPHN|nr:hypothetical protein LK12_12140 [Novosphingobium malaysiense]